MAALLPRAVAADFAPGAQPAEADELLELRSGVQQLRRDEPEPVHRSGAVPVEPPVLPIRGRGLVTMRPDTTGTQPIVLERATIRRLVASLAPVAAVTR